MVRLQKFLADAGVASRRAGERLITDGKVAVNGEVIRVLGTKVDPTQDKVTVEGRPVKQRRKLYIALHKPARTVCSKADEHGRPTVFELLPKEWGHLHSAGRLDYSSEGLLFLTNDGEFSLRITHPRYGLRKVYIATVEGRVEPGAVRLFTEGIWDAGEKLKAERVRILSSSKTQSVVELELAEGKNREVRRLFESQRLPVMRLQRVRIGKIKIGELKPGKWRTLTDAEIKSLLS